jgi:predicted TIM-barrel fold metal-dependent hydrolase
MLPRVGAAQQEDIRELKLRDWNPRPMLVVAEHEVELPRFPAIDVHNHLGSGAAFLTADRVAAYVREMDAAGVRTVVNLDGGSGEELEQTLAALDEAYPGRFRTFGLLDFAGIDDEGWSRRETERLEASFRAGAKGLKLHKSLGLSYRYADGRLMPVDDEKLAPIFELCADHHAPVMIHTADPAAFFTPLDANNERWHELNEHPNWSFYGEQFPAREELLAQFIRVVERHPRTLFIGAHFGNNVEDLATVGRWLDEHPNLVVDIDARISELGRQPFTARKFFLKYQDRILFGTDTPPQREAYRIYYRFLETEDEYFDCAASHHLQGFWRIYGIDLPANVLEKVYVTNPERVLAGSFAPKASHPTLTVPRTEDFQITGKGASAEWERASWQALAPRGTTSRDDPTRFKALHSDKGIYFLMQGIDRRVSATIQEDFADLWKEDVFEVFLWPDETTPLYLEYEISPLGHELPILVPHLDGKFLGWRPWHYEGERKVEKATSVQGGNKEPGSASTGWTAEIFVPYALLSPLQNVPPRRGTSWRANFYRMDYDDGPASWEWSHVGESFHDTENYGSLVFE